ncbi:hypothetical protein [Gelatiniphilus marinus]|uniref:Uncharacterized protein n=1 Tax=Gelatiniphilus marinus TaxID=1759464 RepID=A0ABW5JPN6_9FLAO
MKALLLTLFISLSFKVSAQSLYAPRTNTKISQTTSETFSVTFKKSMYGIAFKTNDRLLTNSLKTKIEQFMINTNCSKFKGLGVFTLNIIKRKGSYFVVEQKKPEKLIEI